MDPVEVTNRVGPFRVPKMLWLPESAIHLGKHKFAMARVAMLLCHTIQTPPSWLNRNYPWICLLLWSRLAQRAHEVEWISIWQQCLLWAMPTTLSWPKISTTTAYPCLFPTIPIAPRVPIAVPFLFFSVPKRYHAREKVYLLFNTFFWNPRYWYRLQWGGEWYYNDSVAFVAFQITPLQQFHGTLQLRSPLHFKLEHQFQLDQFCL